VRDVVTALESREPPVGVTDLQIRRIRFDFDDAVPFNWNPGNPAFSTYMNMVSIIAICFEKMIVSAVREAMPQITDPAAVEEAEAFLRQEAQHANSHRQHVRALIRSYPGLQQTFDASIAAYDRVTATTPLAYRLAYIADLEATFTPFFKMLLDYEDILFRPRRRPGGVTLGVALRRRGGTPQFGPRRLRRGGG
jgi:predicted metal-dependent hydrolase